MSITSILKQSLEIAKKNPVLFVPMLALTVIASLLSLVFLGSMVPFFGGMSGGEQVSSQEALTAAGAAVSGMFAVLILSSILGFIAHGMTVAMADDAVREVPVSLKTGFNKTLAKILPLIISAVLVGIIVSIGFILLVIPGIIAAFLLMFTFLAVMLDNENAFKAMGKSFKMVTGHFSAVFVLFLVLIALGLLSGIISTVVGMIPILGVVLAIIVSAVYTGYISVFLVLAYKGLEDKPPQETPEPEV